MKQSRKKPSAQSTLRSEAEARLAHHAPKSAAPPIADELWHELHVHQIELEMQNEQLRLAQLALEKARDRYLDLYEFAPVGYIVLTPEGQVADINLAGARLLGLTRECLLNLRFDHFLAVEDLECWQRLFINLKKTDALIVEKLKLQRQDGAVFMAQVGCQRKGIMEDTPGAVRLVLIDLSHSETANETELIAAITIDSAECSLIAADTKFRQLAFHDPLTNLPNRRLMLDRLHQAMVAISRTKKYCSVLFIDLDNFKPLNDTLGHDVGDQLLQQVAQRISSCVREGDTVARHGGDEFVVILENLSEHPGDSANQARSIGEKIAFALHQPYQLGAHEYLSSASIGATIFNNPHETAEELLKRADIAMYEAKTAGRNALRFFDPTMQALVTARATLETELRHALGGHELKCHFQPQMDDAGHIPGAEVLLRWQHPEHGLMSPGAFIRVAEDAGLLIAIGQWVLETACAQLKAWEGSPFAGQLHLAVNISARQFHQANFVEHVRMALKKSGVDARNLTLEFKEKIVLTNIEESIAKMAALKKLGVRLAIDDFGMGCTSLSQLTQLPLDQLKIDQSFVHDIGVKPRDKIIIQTLINVSKHLGMDVMAEGVETEDQRAFLEQSGCHVYQGYLFGRPVPEVEFEQMLTRH